YGPTGDGAFDVLIIFLSISIYCYFASQIWAKKVIQQECMCPHKILSRNHLLNSNWSYI
ncbi:MAG: hypothetical protein ACJA1A_001699, partial [Saprospiraceae bacterium]